MDLTSALMRVFVAIAIMAMSAYSGSGPNSSHFDRRSEAASVSNSAAAVLASAVSAPLDFRTGPIAGFDGNDCAPQCLPSCVHTAGFGCCAPGILVDSLAGVVAMANAGALFGAADSAVAGADPEAPQEPPQVLT